MTDKADCVNCGEMIYRAEYHEGWYHLADRVRMCHWGIVGPVAETYAEPELPQERLV